MAFEIESRDREERERLCCKFTNSREVRWDGTTFGVKQRRSHGEQRVTQSADWLIGLPSTISPTCLTNSVPVCPVTVCTRVNPGVRTAAKSGRTPDSSKFLVQTNWTLLWLNRAEIPLHSDGVKTFQNLNSQLKKNQKPKEGLWIPNADLQRENRQTAGLRCGRIFNACSLLCLDFPTAQSSWRRTVCSSEPAVVLSHHFVSEKLIFELEIIYGTISIMETALLIRFFSDQRSAICSQATVRTLGTFCNYGLRDSPS